MRKSRTASAIAILATACAAAAAHAADDESTRKDLFAVIALHGMPCGEVVSVTTRGDNDHVASCRDGNRYHVFVSAEGRVVVQKQ